MKLALPSPQTPAPVVAPAPQVPDSQIDVAKMLQGFISRWWIIALATVLCVAAAVAYIIRTPKMYASYAVLEGSQRSPGVLKGEEEGPSDQNTLEELHTFEQSLTNRTLLVAVARELKLDQDTRLFPKTNKVTSPTDADLAKAITPLVSAGLRRGTRLVDLSAKYYDAETARDIVDKIIELYVAQGASLGSTAAKKTHDHLSQEVQRLEAKMKDSDKALQAFKEQHQGGAVTGLNVGADRIKEMNAQLTIAKGQRLKLEVEMSGLDDAAAQDVSKLLLIPAVAAAPEVVELQKMVGTKEMEFAIVTQRYLYKHPKYVQAQRELQDLTAARDGALLTAVERLRSQYALANESEKRLAQAIAEQEKLALANGRLNMPLGQLESEMAADRELYEVVSKRLKELSVASAVALTNFRVSQSPMVEPDVVTPKKKQTLAVGLAAGMLLGSGIAFALEILRPANGKRDRRGRLIKGVPVLVELPGAAVESLQQALSEMSLPTSPTATSFAQLRASLETLRSDREPRCIAVTSAESGAGKSFCATHLAASYAREGLRTVIIELDFQNPILADVLLEGGPGLPALGLAEGLTGSLSPSAYCHHTMVPNLYLIPVGSPKSNSVAELDKPGFHNLMMLAWNSFDRIVLDTSAVSAMGERMTPVRFAEAVCVVAPQANASERGLGSVLERLLFQGHAPTGIVINHGTPSAEASPARFAVTALPTPEHRTNAADNILPGKSNLLQALLSVNQATVPSTPESRGLTSL